MRLLIPLGVITIGLLLFPFLILQILQLAALLIIIGIGIYLLYHILIGAIAIAVGISSVILAIGLISYSLYILG